MRLSELYMKAFEDGDGVGLELGGYVEQRTQALGRARRAVEGEQEEGQAKQAALHEQRREVLRAAVTGSEVISLDNVVYGKRRRAGAGSANTGVGLLASVAPVTFGLTEDEEEADTMVLDSDDEEFVPDAKRSRATNGGGRKRAAKKRAD
jgi:hypothetical protein